MKHDYTSVKNIYIICGKTDMRKGIDGLATLIQNSFELDPYDDSIFLFSGWSKDRYKCLYFDGDGFAMLYMDQKPGKSKYNTSDGKATLFDDDLSFSELERKEEQSQQTISYTFVRNNLKKNEMIHYVMISKYKHFTIIQKIRYVTVAKDK